MRGNENERCGVDVVGSSLSLYIHFLKLSRLKSSRGSIANAFYVVANDPDIVANDQNE